MLTVLVIVALIVWLFPAAAILVGSQLAPIEDDAERIRRPADVLRVLAWPFLALLFIVRPSK